MLDGTDGSRRWPRTRRQARKDRARRARCGAGSSRAAASARLAAANRGRQSALRPRHPSRTRHKRRVRPVRAASAMACAGRGGYQCSIPPAASESASSAPPAAATRWISARTAGTRATPPQRRPGRTRRIRRCRRARATGPDAPAWRWRITGRRPAPGPAPNRAMRRWARSAESGQAARYFSKVARFARPSPRPIWRQRELRSSSTRR